MAPVAGSLFFVILTLHVSPELHTALLPLGIFSKTRWALE